MLLFFRHISTMGRQAEYQIHQQPTLELSAQDNHCNGVGLTRANLFPFLFKTGTRVKLDQMGLG